MTEDKKPTAGFWTGLGWCLIWLGFGGCCYLATLNTRDNNSPMISIETKR